jgi:hypothetical protein
MPTIIDIPAHLQNSDSMGPSANLEDTPYYGDTLKDKLSSGHMSSSEDDESRSRYTSSSEEEHSVIFEVAEEIFEGPAQPLDFDYESDFLDDSEEEDSAEMEDAAPFEASEESDQIRNINDSLPEAVLQLQEKLLGDYALPPPPVDEPVPYTLSEEEKLSLQHYLAWTESQGTVKAYSSHAKVLAEATNTKLLSLYAVRKLAEKLTGLSPLFIDMCPRSCIAYTGDFQSQNICTHSRDGKICNEPCYKQTQGPRAIPKPRAQMLYIPITPILQTCYSVADTSKEMRYRDRCLQETLKLLAVAAGVNKPKRQYSDFPTP